MLHITLTLKNKVITEIVVLLNKGHILAKKEIYLYNI